MERWSADRANEWAKKIPWIIGCNYIPADAVNQLEMWQSDSFNPERIKQELGWAKDLGINSVRVFLHDLAFSQDENGFLDRIKVFLEIADQFKITMVPVFFDDCWYEGAVIGKQKSPIPGLHNSRWNQSPGKRRAMDKNNWPALKKYLQSVMEAFKKDPRILFWDTYNENSNFFLPILSSPFLKKWPALIQQYLSFRFLEKPTVPLMIESFDWAREMNPSQPITSASWFPFKKFNELLYSLSDIITFHNYDPVPSLESEIGNLKIFDRPIFCTEYMGRSRKSLFETHLPIFKKERVGCFHWGLVSGKTQTIYSWEDPPSDQEPDLWYHDVLRSDGSPYRESESAAFKKVRD